MHYLWIDSFGDCASVFVLFNREVETDLEPHHESHAQWRITATTDGYHADRVSVQSGFHLAKFIKSNCFFQNSKVYSVVVGVKDGIVRFLKIKAIHEVNHRMEVHNSGAYEQNLSSKCGHNWYNDNAMAFSLLAPHTSNHALVTRGPFPV